MSHVFGFDMVKFGFGKVAELHGGFLEADMLLMSGVGYFRGVVVADARGQGGDQHQGILHVPSMVLRLSSMPMTQ